MQPPQSARRAAHALDGGVEFTEPQMLARARHASEPAQDQAAQRLAAALSFDHSRGSERVLQLAERDRARSRPFVVGNFYELGNFGVELVANFTEQFLEQVFECDQAEQA